MPHKTQTPPATGKNQKEEARDKTKDLREDPPTSEKEDSLDRTLEESFPASDPPSSIPDPDADVA